MSEQDATAAAPLPETMARNAAGGVAYDYGARHRLVQLAITATLSDRAYSTAGEEVAALVAAARAVSPEFLAKAAIYAHEQGHMKEGPALLLAVLAGRDPALFARAFGRVITTGKMLRAFVRAMRSGVTGRRSLGTRPKVMVRNWLDGASDAALLAAGVGNNPSMKDLIRMVHPKPADAARAAFYGWFLGQDVPDALLPDPVRRLVEFRRMRAGKVPDVPFQYLANLPLTAAQWGQIARGGSWQMLRQGLNMLQAKGAFDSAAVVAHVAGVLRDPVRIAAARVLPYQIMATLAALDPACDARLRAALVDACDIALANVPRLAGSVAICPDVSGSMAYPVTGIRKEISTAVRCIDVAALMAVAFLRKNPQAQLLPFDTELRPLVLDPSGPVQDNAERLAALAGGNTDCVVPLRALLATGQTPDLVILISDNQSWVAPAQNGAPRYLLSTWEELRKRNPAARLICIDLQPYGTTQAPERPDILNIGGFSDLVFDVIADFAAGHLGPDHWMQRIEEIAL